MGCVAAPIFRLLGRLVELLIHAGRNFGVLCIHLGLHHVSERLHQCLGLSKRSRAKYNIFLRDRGSLEGGFFKFGGVGRAELEGHFNFGRREGGEDLLGRIPGNLGYQS